MRRKKGIDAREKSPDVPIAPRTRSQNKPPPKIYYIPPISSRNVPIPINSAIQELLLLTYILYILNKQNIIIKVQSITVYKIKH